MLKKVIFSMLIFIIFGMSLTGCGDSGYDDFESKFYEQYYKIIQNIDSKEVNDILQKMQSQENINILNDMNLLIQDYKGKVPKKMEEKFDELVSLYTGLVDLKAAYNKLESLSIDEQQHLDMQLSTMYYYLSKLEYDKDQNSK